MLSDARRLVHSKEYKLHRRRWAFLFTLSALQLIYGFAFSCFGQISNIFVAFFRISYAQVDWLTLAVNIGPVVLTIPLSWMITMKWLGFRTLALTIASSFAIGFVCLTSSVASRSLYPLMLVGQIINSVAGTALIASPSTFAVLWFPDHQVGTAIALNSLTIYVGCIIGWTLPSNILSKASPINGTITNQTWIVNDQKNLAGIFSSFLFIALASTVFLFIYLTDYPPTPPTRAQEIKQENKEDVIVLSLTSYAQLVKSLLTNQSYVLACFVFGTLFQVNTVEFTMLSQILRQMFSKKHNRYKADVMGGYIMVAFAIGSVIGGFIGGFVVNRYKRYNIITIVTSLFSFLSTVGMTIAFIIDSLPLFFTSTALFGLGCQSGLVAIYEIITQETYPIKEEFAAIWLSGIQAAMGIFYGEIGRILFNLSGGLAVLIFQSVSVFLSVVFSCLLKTENKRLNVDECSHDVTANMGERSVLIFNRQ